MKQDKHRIEENWVYDLIWETQEPLLVEESLMTFCEKDEILLTSIKVQEQTLSFRLMSPKQLNIQKWNQSAQKKVKGSLLNEEAIIISHGHEVARNDLRLCKVIDSIREADYYDLEEGMIDEDLEKLKEYLKSQRISVIEQGKQLFLVDEKALLAKINLNCFECTKRHQYGCCCGSPCHMSEKNKNLLDKHLLNIEDALKKLDKAQYEVLIQKGGFLAANGDIKAFDGHCALLIEDEGVYKCMAHKYALDEQIPIYDLCPLSCLMYPLEIIELITDKKRKIILLSAAVEEFFAENFSRWGSYKSLGVELRCIQEEAHDKGFKKEAYQPVYKVNENLLKHEFKAALWNGLQHLLG